MRHQDALDAAIGKWAATIEAYDGMMRLQSAGVPAGVCQTAGDRCDSDPQLAALHWMTEITGTKIGRWPVPEFPVKLSRTPSYAGGPIDRGAPCYGEDNKYILETLLGMSPTEIADLAAQGIL
jgi:crotonobetainyl-CoA:carnitine CoA-transferase CaiB-like acyl-CoA transferase